MKRREQPHERRYAYNDLSDAVPATNRRNANDLWEEIEEGSRGRDGIEGGRKSPSIRRAEFTIYTNMVTEEDGFEERHQEEHRYTACAHSHMHNDSVSPWACTHVPQSTHDHMYRTVIQVRLTKSLRKENHTCTRTENITSDIQFDKTILNKRTITSYGVRHTNNSSVFQMHDVLPNHLMHERLYKMTREYVEDILPCKYSLVMEKMSR